MVLLAQVPMWVTGLLIALFLFVSVLMMLVVLIQRPAGGGLSGAFGSGAGSGQTAFGAKTGDALTMATIAVFVLYLLFAIALNFAARPTGVVPARTPADPIPPAAPIGGPIEDRPPPALTPEFVPPEPEPGLPPPDQGAAPGADPQTPPPPAEPPAEPDPGTP
jgi:preprotein translocase subunit SecG